MLWRAKTVHPHDIRPSVQQRLGGGGGVCAFCGFVFVFETDRDHHRQPSFLGALHAEERFAEPRKRLSNDEINTLVALHLELFVERLTDAVGRLRAVWFVHPGKTQIARDQTLLARYFFCDADGIAVDILDAVFESDGGQLVTAGIEGQSL